MTPRAIAPAMVTATKMPMMPGVVKQQLQVFFLVIPFAFACVGSCLCLKSSPNLLPDASDFNPLPVKVLLHELGSLNSNRKSFKLISSSDFCGRQIWGECVREKENVHLVARAETAA